MGAQTDCGAALLDKKLDPFGVCPSPQAEATLLRQPQPRTEQGARVWPISLIVGTSLLGHFVPEVSIGLAETQPDPHGGPRVSVANPAPSHLPPKPLPS